MNLNATTNQKKKIKVVFNLTIAETKINTIKNKILQFANMTIKTTQQNNLHTNKRQRKQQVNKHLLTNFFDD
jgi:hypothetical protein